MLTINGARALGLADKIGSLEVGKRADFIVWDTEQLNSYPRHDFITQIIFAGNSSQIQDVWIDGNCLLEDRVPTRFSLSELFEKAKHWEEKTKEFC